MDLGQVFTNKNVAEYMVSLFCLDKNAALLDPCFGSGAFLHAATLSGYSNIEGYEIDPNLYHMIKKKYPEMSLYNQDFLCADSIKKYDGVIMNPPYVRQEKIDDLKPFGITKKILRENQLFASLPSTANLYMYFIIKSIDLLKDGGELVVIFPSSWLQAKSGKQFEKSLYSKCTLIKQIHIVGEVFEKNALVEVVILHLAKGDVSVDAVVENVKISNGTLKLHQTVSNNKEVDLIIPFSNIGIARRGLTTGCNSMYINPLFDDEESFSHLVPIISSPKAIKGYGMKNVKTDYIFIPNPDLDFSQEIQDYLTEWKARILDVGQPKTLLNKITSNEDSWYFIKAIDSAGILFSYFVRNDMKFVLNESGYLARDNFYIIKPCIEILLAFALLNNYFTFLQLEKSGKKYGAGLLKLQRYDIEELKFPDIHLFSNEDIKRLKELSEKLINTGNANVIDDITRIIANYTTVDFDTVAEQYFAIKKQRLEVHVNGK